MSSVAEKIMQREKACFEADPIGLVSGKYLEIRNKAGDLVPLTLNSTQARIIEKIQERRRRGLPAFLFVLKARQLGVSTLTQAVMYSFASQRSYINGLVVADDVDGASYIFKMNELFHQRMSEKHPHLTPEKSRSSEQRLEFAKTFSRLMIDTAKNATAGRKFTLQLVHLSEVAFYKNFTELKQALMPAIARTPDTVVVFETTANGVNDVSKFYWKMKALYDNDPQNAEWIVMFCSWKEHGEYSRAFANAGLRGAFESSLSTKEKKLTAEHGLSLEQLHWRRQVVENDFDGDDEKFEVEYPLTDREAFKSSSKQVFPARLSDPQRVHIFNKDGTVIGAKARGEMELLDRRASFVPDPDGYLRIYQEAQPEERYVIGADSCESALTHDEACAQVIKRSTWTQVAHLHGHMNPEDFAERLIALGLYYNRALLAPERNGPGLVTVTYLAGRHYPNICRIKRSVVSDEGQWTETEEYGFHTNAKTKPYIIDQLQTSLRTLLLVLKDAKTYDELTTYVVTNVNKEGHVEMGAEQGHRDDCVMALAIAVHYAHQLPSIIPQLGSAREFMSRSITGY